MSAIIHTKPGDLPDYAPITFPRAVPEPESWPEPDPTLLRRGRRRPPPLPSEVFGPWDRWIRDTAEAAGAPPDYVAMPLISVWAALIGNARIVSPWGDWKEPAIIWAGIVGDPSSGKSPGSEPVLSLVRAIEREQGEGFDETYRQYKTHVASAEIIREQWEGKMREAIKAGAEPPTMPAAATVPREPERPRIITSDTTPERLGTLLAANPKGLLNNRDELSGWLAGFDRYSKGGGERSFWLEANGGRSYTVDRVKAGGSVHIPHLSISVFGGIQPDRLMTMLLTGDDDGLPARFIWAWPDSLPPKRATDSVPNDDARDALRRLANLRPGRSETGDYPILMRLDKDAADDFEQWRIEHYASTKATAGMVESAWGKLPGTLLRLAMLLELSAWAIGAYGAPEPATVSLASTLRARGLVEEYIKPMIERVYGDAAMPHADRNAATLARRIAYGKLSKINIRSMYRSDRLPGLKDRQAYEEAAAVLVDAGWLIPDATLSVGRPRSDYTVNPKVADLTERGNGNG